MTFKRYFLGHFLYNLDIFTTVNIGAGRENFDSQASFSFSLLFALSIFMKQFSAVSALTILRIGRQHKKDAQIAQMLSAFVFLMKANTRLVL